MGSDASSDSIDGTPGKQSENQEEEVKEEDGFQAEKKSELIRVGTSSLNFSRTELHQVQSLN